MLVTEKRMAGADGAPIHLTVWEPDGPAQAVLQLVHGFGESAGRYKRWARRFTERGWAVYAHDLRGHGKTPGKRGIADYNALLDDIAAVRTRIAAEQPGLRVSLYGHSLGGNLVINRLLDAPAGGHFGLDSSRDACREGDYERAVVTNPWLAPHREYPPFLIALLRPLVRAIPGFTLYAGLRKEDLSGDGAYLDQTLQDGSYHLHMGARLFLQTLDAGMDAVERAGELRTPLLILRGEEDHVSSQEAIAAFAVSAFAAARRAAEEERMPPAKVTLRSYPQRHELHNDERRGEVFAHICAFLESDREADR